MSIFGTFLRARPSRLSLIKGATWVTLVCASSLAWAAGGYPYLDDSNMQPDAPPEPGPFPRVMLTETKAPLNGAEQFTKYDLIGTKAGQMNKVVEVQRLNPDVKFHYAFSPRAYQGYIQSDPCEQGMGLPFNDTGPATGNCTVFAGHFLYNAGTVLSQYLDRTSTTIYVQDASRLKVGRFVVIYDAPAGSFANAEHAKVVGVDRSVTPNKVTLQARGFKSTPSVHARGAIVAEHDIGEGGSAENWTWNMTTQGPRDANGKTIAQVVAKWLADNQDRNARGARVDIRVDGVYFDADGYDISSPRMDANNDLVVDGGMSPLGVNWWGEGLEQFYATVRNWFPDQRVVGGSRRTRGFDALDGTQMESFPVARGYSSVNPDYESNDGLDSLLQRYTIHMRYHNTKDVYVENLSKAPTKLYPDGGTAPATNAAFRLGFGLTLLDGGYYGKENSKEHPDPWYDEYAVNVVEGSPSYGRAMASNPNDESGIRAHKGWLGFPVGPRQRVYDSALFAANRSLVSNGGFEAGANGWSGNNVSIKQVTNTAAEGSASLHVSGHLKYDDKLASTKVQGPAVAITAGKQYTLAFAAKSSAMRQMNVRVNGTQGQFLIPDRWTRVVYTFTASNSGNFRPQFYLGQEDTQVWLDAVYLFEGNANVFRRDYEHGIVVVNATPSARTVDLGGTFKRIRGTGQDAINDGSSVTKVTLPAWDAAILVRPEGTAVKVGSTGGSTGGTTGGSTSGTTGGSTGGTTGSGSTSGTTAEAPCGVPSYDPLAQQALVVWEDTCTPGTWHLRAISGGETLNFQGQLRAKNNFGTVTPVTTESNDVIDTSDASRIGYSFFVYGGRSEDGIDFEVPQYGEVCLELDSPSSAVILAGPDAKSVGKQVNLRNLGACASPLSAAEGEPVYDAGAKQATYLWKDADTDNWHLRVTGGSSSKPVSFKGQLNGVAAWRVNEFRLEGNDQYVAGGGGTMYDLSVKGNGEDGLDFSAPVSLDACLDIGQSDSNVLFLGESMTRVTAPISLSTLGSCK